MTEQARLETGSCGTCVGQLRPGSAGHRAASLSMVRPMRSRPASRSVPAPPRPRAPGSSPAGPRPRETPGPCPGQGPSSAADPRRGHSASSALRTASSADVHLPSPGPRPPEPRLPRRSPSLRKGNLASGAQRPLPLPLSGTHGGVRRASEPSVYAGREGQSVTPRTIARAGSLRRRGSGRCTWCGPGPPRRGSQWGR